MFDRVTPFFSSRSFWMTILAFGSLAFFLFKTPILFERLCSPVQVQPADAITLERTSILAQGQSLYVPSDQQGPYLYAAYPPLFFELASFLTRWVPNPWMPARILSLTGFAGIGLLFGFWFGSKKGWVWGLLACSMFWILPIWTRWSTVDRVDALYIFLNFAAFLLLYQDWKKERSELGFVVLAGLINATAILVKQTAVSLIVAYLISCFLIGAWRRASVFALAALGPVLFFVAYEEWVTKGYFLKHTFFWLHTGYRFNLFLGFFLTEFLPQNDWLIILVFLFVLLKRQPLFLLLQMGAVTLELFSLGREGSAENYWLNFSMFAFFFALESVDMPERDWVQGRFKKAQSVLLLILLATGVLYGGLDRRLLAPSPDVIAMKKEAVSFFPPGESLILDTDLAVMAGKRVWIQPIEYTEMIHLGIWKTGPLIHDIETKKFTSIEVYDAARQYFLPDEVMEAIQKNYHPFVRKYGRVWLLANRT